MLFTVGYLLWDNNFVTINNFFSDKEYCQKCFNIQLKEYQCRVHTKFD